VTLGRANAAGGRVEWKSKTLKESDGHAWTIEVAIYLNRAPDVNTLPMRFSFQPSVYYERSLLDGKDGPQERKVPLEGKPPLVESVDVGFMDPGNGQIQKRTKFSFKVTRAHGYEAGEYDVTIRDGRTDAPMGAATHVVFDGENEVIDRRAMVFSGNDKKKKPDADAKKDDKGDDKAAGSDDKKANDEKPASDNDSKDSTADAPKADEKPSDEPGTIKEKPGGCGCRLADANDSGKAGLGFAALALSTVVLRRRKKRAA
jgi:MYXO-CTERM domain-containing protein